MSLAALFRYDDGVVPNVAALTYTVFGYLVGVTLLMGADTVPLATLGCLLVTHTLIYSAYFVHELMHGSIFKHSRHARMVAEVLLWMSDSYFRSFKELQKAHLDHHALHVDVLRFNFKSFLVQRNWLRRVVLVMEWACIPIMDVLARAEVFARNFADDAQPAERRRVLSRMATRLGFFALMTCVSPGALLLYCVSYGAFLHVLRFLDAHQHTYDLLWYTPDGQRPEIPHRDRKYEDSNTYSNLLSTRMPWLNLLVLNFPYHNAHHALPREPWYRLPELHRDLYGDGAKNELPIVLSLAGYLRHRVRRILTEDYGQIGPDKTEKSDYVGALGVSFLY